METKLAQILAGDEDVTAVYDQLVSPEWPLAGRAAELRFVADTLSARGDTAGVLLAGAAGVGKSRLAREAVDAAAKRGAATRWAVATASARALPLGVFSHLVTALPTGEPNPGLFRHVGDALVAGGPSGRVLMGVDDAHLLDDLSAAVVHQLAVQRAARLLVTVRTGEPAPDAVTALWKDGHLRRLEVQPLSAAEIAALIEAVLGGPVESLSAQRLYAATRGNVLFLRQLVDGGRETGSLRQVVGVWQWRGDTVVTPGLGDLVDERIGRLSDALREVVEVLAFGEPLGVPLLEKLTDPAAVEEAERRGLVTVEPDGRRWEARLAHPLYGEVVRARTSTLRAHRLRGRLATALAATGARRSSDILRRATLVLDSDLAPDPKLLTLAAEQATTLCDMALGERLARAASAAGGGFDATLTLGKVLSWEGDPRAAEEVLGSLPALAATDAQRVIATIPRAANLFFPLGDLEASERALQDGIDAVQEPRLREELLAVGSAFAALQNRPTVAVDTAQGIVASPGADDMAVSWAVAALALSLPVLGRGDEVPGLVERHRPAAESLVALTALRYIQGMGELMAVRLTGRLDLADELLQRYAELSGGSLWASPIVALFRGQAACARGLPNTAVRWLREAASSFNESERNGRFQSLVALTQAQAITGNPAAARLALAEAETLYRPTLTLLEPDLYLARARVAAADGVISEAIETARQAATVAADSGQRAFEVVALHAAVCFGDRSAAASLAELATVVDGPLAPAAAAHAAGLAEGDGDALDAASRRLEHLGALLSAADAVAQAALAHRRRGARSREIAAAARAHQLAERCEGARTPALRAAARPLPLTNREREIVSLVAAGLSNREIAERFVVSVRTVEGHIYRACGKLGASDRATLAALLRTAEN